MGETIRAHKAEYSDKIGNFWREIKYPIQAFLVLVSFVGLVIGIPGLIAFNIDITVPSLIFLSWSWFAYVKPNWDAMNTSWSKEINNLAKFQDEGMNDIHADHAQLSAPQTIYQAGQVLPAANPEIKGKGQGGIDLNFKPQFIPRPSQERTEYFEKAVIPAMPDGFKGFNFNIVRFRSQLTVNGAFQLMCNSN